MKFQTFAYSIIFIIISYKIVNIFYKKLFGEDFKFASKMLIFEERKRPGLDLILTIFIYIGSFFLGYFLCEKSGILENAPK